MKRALLALTLFVVGCNSGGSEGSGGGGGSSASGGGTGASGGGTSASGGGTSASGGGTSASGGGTSASGGGTSASGGGTSASGGGTSASGGGTSASGGGTSASGGGTSASGGGTSASGGGTSASGGGTSASGGGTSASGGGTSASGGGTSASGGGTSASGGGTSASGGGTSGSGGGSAITDAGANFAFVTSQTFTGALGGVAGADKACQNVAADAGLSGSFRAWLSVDGGSAATRFAGARGWIRPDGKPFTDTLDGLLTNHRIFYPLMITERRTVTPFSTSYVWTGTDDDGTTTPQNCIDWSTADAGSTGYAGSPDDLGRGWTHNTAASCNQARPLFCLGYDRAVPVAPVRPAGARVAFVTNGAYLLGPGLVAADQLCATEAAAAGLSGSFLALLSTDGGSAASRFKTDAGTWVRPDNAALMPTAAEVFTAAFLQAGMNVTADAGTYTCGPAYWTGGPSPTALGTQTCMDWTSTNGQANGGYGASCYLDRWFAHSTVPCNFSASHLYCLEQ